MFKKGLRAFGLGLLASGAILASAVPAQATINFLAVFDRDGNETSIIGSPPNPTIISNPGAGTFNTTNFGPRVVQYAFPNPAVTAEAGWLFITADGSNNLAKLLAAVHFLGDNTFRYALNNGNFPFIDAMNNLMNLPGPGETNIQYTGLFGSIPVPGVLGALWQPTSGQPGFLTAGSPAGNPSNFAYGFIVPEPASMALLGAGLFGLGTIRRRRG